METRTNREVGPDEIYEESIILIEAGSEEEAKEKATIKGKERETQYVNCNGNVVSWHFCEVKEVQRVLEEQIFSGAQVYYQWHWKRDVDSAQSDGTIDTKNNILTKSPQG